MQRLKNAELEYASVFRKELVRGDNCRYRHEEVVATKRPKIACRDFQNGVCKRGEKCNYVHEAKEAARRRVCSNVLVASTFMIAPIIFGIRI